MRIRKTLLRAILPVLLVAALPMATRSTLAAPASQSALRSASAIAQMVSEVNAQAVMADIQQLESFETRYLFTPNLEAAGEYLYNAFSALGLRVERDRFTLGDYATNNIVATLPGRTDPSHVVIVGAHYDSASNAPLVLAPGADDNASGTAVVLELARVLHSRQFDFTIKFIAFSGEERKLLGSQHYAWFARYITNEKILAMVNLDMVGYVDREPEDLDLIANQSSEWLADVFADAASRYTSLPTLKSVNDTFARSDNAAFWAQGYTAICAAEDFPPPNPYYHRTSDTSGTLNPVFLGNVAKASLATVATLAQPVSSPAPPTSVEAHPLVLRSLFLRATVGSLTWTQPSGQAAGYNVYRSAQIHRGYQKINRSPVRGTSFVDRTVPADGTYYYVVIAVDTNGTEGNPSAPAVLTMTAR